MASSPSRQDSSRKRHKAVETMSSHESVPHSAVDLSDLVASEAFGNNKTSTMTSRDCDSRKETLFVTHSSTSNHNDILTRLAQARANLETKFEKPQTLQPSSHASESQIGQDLGLKIGRPARKFKLVTAGKGSRGEQWESQHAEPPPKTKAKPTKKVGSGTGRSNGKGSSDSSSVKQTRWMPGYDPAAQGQPEVEVLKPVQEEYTIFNVTSGGPPRGFVPVCEQNAARRALGLKVNRKSDSNSSTSQENSKPLHPAGASRSDNKPWVSGVIVGARALGRSSQSEAPRPEVADTHHLVNQRKHVQFRRERSLSCPASVFDAARQFSRPENVVSRLSEVSSVGASRDRGTHLTLRYRTPSHICDNEYQTIVNNSLAPDWFPKYKISSGTQSAPSSPNLLASQNKSPVFEAQALSKNSNHSTSPSGTQQYSEKQEYITMDPARFGFPTQQRQVFINRAGIPVSSGSQRYSNDQENLMMNPVPSGFPMQQPPFFMGPGAWGTQHYPGMQEGLMMNPMHFGFPMQQQQLFMNPAVNPMAPGSQHYLIHPGQFLMNPAPPGFPFEQYPFPMNGPESPVALGSQQYSNKQEGPVLNPTSARLPVPQHQIVKDPVPAPPATPPATPQASPPRPPAPKWTIKYEWDAARGTGAQHFSPTDGTEPHGTLEAWYHYETQIGYLKPTSKIDFDCDIAPLGIRQNSRLSFWALGAWIEKRQKLRDQRDEETRIEKAKRVELKKQAGEKKKQANAEAKEKKVQDAAEAKKTRAALAAERKAQKKEANKEKRRLLKEKKKKRDEKELREKELREKDMQEKAEMDECARMLEEDMEKEKEEERRKLEQQENTPQQAILPEQESAPECAPQFDKETKEDEFDYLFEDDGEMVEGVNEYKGETENASDVSEEVEGSEVYHIRNADVAPLQEGEDECTVYEEAFEAQCETSDSESEVSEAE